MASSPIDLGALELATNDICRFCKQNMRKAGVLNHSADIFKKNYKPESICERLERIGLKIVRTTQRSNRVCQRCVTIISRLERDLPVLMEWIEEEKELKEHAGERDGESTPFNNVTETPPPPPKKFRPDPSLPIPAPPATSTERSVTQVITWYPSKKMSVKQCDPEDASTVINIASKNLKAAAKHIMKNMLLVDELKLQILHLIEKECKSLCNPNSDFMLWKTAPEDLKAFSLPSLLSDLSRLSPFLLSIISAASKHHHPATAAAVAIALRGRQPRLSAFSHHLARILHKGGARKAVFKRLSKMCITTSHCSALQKLRELDEHKKPALRQKADDQDQGENDSGDSTSDMEEPPGEDEDDLSVDSTYDYEEVIVGEKGFYGDGYSDDAEKELSSGEPMTDPEEEGLGEKDFTGEPISDLVEDGLGKKDFSDDPARDPEEPLGEKGNSDDRTDGSEKAQ